MEAEYSHSLPSLTNATGSDKPPLQSAEGEHRRQAITLPKLKSKSIAVCTSTKNTGKSTRRTAIASKNTPVPGIPPRLPLLGDKELAWIARLKAKVRAAVNEHKTFTVYGNFPAIRTSLQSRGWVENMSRDQYLWTLVSCCCSPEASAEVLELKNGETEFTAKECWFMARLLQHQRSDFIWCPSFQSSDIKKLGDHQLVSKIARPKFATKTGLCDCLRQSHWFTEEGVSYVRFPRCYNVEFPDELEAFQQDYKLTACASLLQCFVRRQRDGGAVGVTSCSGKVPLRVIDYAASCCEEYIMQVTHTDIDMPAPNSDTGQWKEFLSFYYLLVHENTLLEPSDEELFQSSVRRAKNTLSRMQPFWPQIVTDGELNLWIVKPGCSNRGNGIHVVKTLEDILAEVTSFSKHTAHYVVQKYIERPLLIYNTKFDIRQWFLVTSVCPLTVWMYKTSYLRFCSQQFSLDNLQPAVHLCNDAIQCYLQNGSRDSRLPEENMWHSDTFRKYLQQVHQEELWEQRIVPGMQQAILGTMLSVQENMESRRNSFELFGADFMLDEDLQPWLIEINEAPCFSYTTSVTTVMCAECLDDVIKVVVDRRQDKQADTGQFQMLYHQTKDQAFPSSKNRSNLCLRGKYIVPKFKSKKRTAPIHDRKICIRSVYIEGDMIDQCVQTDPIVCHQESTQTIPPIPKKEAKVTKKQNSTKLKTKRSPGEIKLQENNNTNKKALTCCKSTQTELTVTNDKETTNSNPGSKTQILCLAYAPGNLEVFHKYVQTDAIPLTEAATEDIIKTNETTVKEERKEHITNCLYVANARKLWATNKFPAKAKSTGQHNLLHKSAKNNTASTKRPS